MRDSPQKYLSSYFGARFGSKVARFKSAVALGLAITTIGFLVAGPIARPSSADEGIWGAMSSLFGGAPARVDQAMIRQDAPAMSRSRHSLHTAHRHPAATAALDQDGTKPSGGHTMCVRVCDGYAFPVGAYHGQGDNAAHQAICQASCPDAKTALYVLPNGSDEIGAGVDLVSGHAYSELPDAFHYATVLDSACTCHRDSADGKALSLLRDFTLRRGDAVMTAGGVRVFHGSMRFPYRRTDFVALSRSRDVLNPNRAAMRAIERASMSRMAGAPGRAGPRVSQNPAMSVRPVGPDLVTGAARIEPADRG
jgi:hypothetical protein